MSLLSVKNVGKAFVSYQSELHRFARWFCMSTKPSEEHSVLRNVNFEIQPGEAIGILGKNGAGKSTLLKMITGTLQPTDGEVEVNGDVAAILELGMGFNPELTGRQNAFHSAGIMGFSANEIQQVMSGIEEFADIGEYFEAPVRTYSTGMQARVAFAVATAFKPDLLIIDEALSVGDAYFQAKCYERIKDYKEKGMALLLVTHSVEDIVRHCDRALFIKSGTLALDGAPRDVTNLYLDELFGKSTINKNESDTKDGHNLTRGSEDVFATRHGYRKEEHRWGQGGATIVDYLIVADDQEYPARILGDSKTDFYFKVCFEKKFDDVVPGFLIKTLEGLSLYSTNSSLASCKSEIISVSVGDIFVFKFSLPLALNEGDYLVSFGISSRDVNEQFVPLERRYDSVIVSVEQLAGFQGLINLDATFEISNET